MVIFATSQIRAIFLAITCFLNQVISHETTLMQFLLICVFSSQVFIFQVCPRDAKEGEKVTNKLSGDCPICFFFLASVHDKSPCIFLLIRTSYRRYRIEVT